MNPEHSFGERFSTLTVVQQELERPGYFLYPVAREHVEAGVTDPLVHRIRTQINKHGFDKMAGKVAITFSGYAYDDREVFPIPETRAYWRTLDRQLPELPALLAYLPPLGFNGPGIHLLLVGTVEEATARPELGGYDVSVTDTSTLIADTLGRIRQAGRTYHLRPNMTHQLIHRFLAGVTHQLERI